LQCNRWSICSIWKARNSWSDECWWR